MAGAAQRLQRVGKLGEEARVVGGAVRNVLLGEPIGDIDVATTATPEEVSTVATTPGTARAFSSLNVFTDPPSTGGCASAAYSMPGRRTSMPNCALPSTFAGVSRRCIFVPTYLKLRGSLSGTFSGTGNAAAASASSPNDLRFFRNLT